MTTSDQENSIVATKQKTVLFREDKLVAVRVEDGYASVSHLADALSLGRQEQGEKK